MPALSPTMTHGAVAEWKVKEGQTIAAGDVLADIETDKATMALESMEDGVVAKILVQNGAADVEVGTVLGVVAEDAADVRAFAGYEAPSPPEIRRFGGATLPASPLNVSGTEPSNAPDLGRVWPSVRRLLARRERAGRLGHRAHRSEAYAYERRRPGGDGSVRAAERVERVRERFVESVERAFERAFERRGRYRRFVP